jgi:transcriptional regulator with XRE-family HTH domain
VAFSYLSVMNMEMESTRIGEKIRKIRELKGLKQVNVAEKLGMTLNGYGKIERGETAITMERLEQVSNILGMKVLDVLHFDEKVVFNIQKMDNSAPNGIINNYPVSNSERDLFLQQIIALKEIIETQKELIQELRKRK